jgi:hypothetical protein
MQDYTPLKTGDLKRKFKLQAVAASEALKQGKELHVAGCQLKLKGDSELEVSGTDTTGKAWLVVTGYSGLGTTIFTGDLDKNGVEDIVIVGVTGGCGYAPPKTFDAILFDKKRCPMLWGVDTYAYQDRKAAFDDLIVLGNDPRAVLVQQNIVYHSVGKKTYSYWRTLLYRAEHGNWQLLKQYDGHLMPLLVRFRFKPNRELVKAIPSDLKGFQDASTLNPARPESKEHFKEVQLCHIKQDDQGAVETMDFGAGFVPSDSFNNLYYRTAIYRDSGAVFEAASLPSNLASELLKDVYQRKSLIKIPVSTMAGCPPTEIWIVD